MIKKIALFFVILFLFISCKKDYREQYIGTWDFVAEKTKSIVDSIVIDEYGYSHYFWSYEYDTIYYLGTVDFGSADYELNIRYSENNSIMIEITECGKVSRFTSDSYPFLSGEFKGKDNLFLNFAEDHGVGYVTYCDLRGTKK